MLRTKRADILAILALIALWLLFFWRLFTPIEADRASLVNGDFSGQFVAFAGYQYERFASGEIPLWNPYNNGGFPFIGDTQAAVFYPPRLVTIALSSVSGGWTYHALELEMAFHVLAYSLLMYLFVRRLTANQQGSEFGAFIAGIVVTYGGFTSSYPQLQLAILEAVIWLPLAALGILEATRHERIRWLWLILTGFALGVSWMAGHPQTSFFLTYLLIGYFAYRCYVQKFRWTNFITGTAIFGIVTVGVVAVQLLPGLEYLMHTARTGLGFDAKGNGLLFQDISQFLFPGALGPWSPLYVGISGLALAVIAVWRGVPHSKFWAVIALIGLILSVGANSTLYPALYNLIPGMRFFRGQERAALLVANGLAILAGLGAAHLVTWNKLQDFKASRRIQQGLLLLTIICAIFAASVFITLIDSPDVYTKRVSGLVFSTIIAAAGFLIIPFMLSNPADKRRLWLLAALVTFELFSVNMDNSNFEPVPPQTQLSITPPALIEPIPQDTALPFRVDGYRGLHDNYGSLYGVMDMRGISPLFIDDPFTLIEPEHINPLAWELLSVKYVYSDWDELPVPSEIITSGDDRYGVTKLHRLSNPRPFAHLVYDTAAVDSDEFARALLKDPNFNPRNTVILNQEVPIKATEDTGTANVAVFEPERFVIEVDTPTDAILSLAHPDYPGWYATIDGQPTDILRAYGALSAVVIPQGEHTVEFVYNPLSYRLGALLSLFTWSALTILVVVLMIRVWRADVRK